MKVFPIILTIVTACGVASTVAAEQQTFVTASQLGNMLASESFCGLSYDQDAIAGYISSMVPDTDMGFNGTMSMMITGIKTDFPKMSASEKTAHCAQTARVAKRYKFIK